MPKNLKVLVIPTWLPTGEDRIMGIYHKQFCEALSKYTDADVNMLFIKRERLKNLIKYFTLKKTCVSEENGYSILTRRMLNVRPVSFALHMHNYKRAVFKAYCEYEKLFGKPDIIHAHVSVPAGYCAVQLGKKFNIPVVVTEHATYYERFFTGKNKKYMDDVLKYAYCTTVGNYMIPMFKSHGASCELLPNMVDCSIFLTAERNTPSDTLSLISVCALRESKKVDNIAAAMKILMNSGRITNIRLTIVGDGFLEKQYQDSVRSMGMDDYVTFVGRKTREEISDILAKHDALVVSSEIETFGIPAVEALASGIPVVSTKNGGVDEYLTEECGELCEINDPSSLADAIERMYKKLHSGAYDVETLRKTALRFSSEHVAAEATHLYSDILSSKKLPRFVYHKTDSAK